MDKERGLNSVRRVVVERACDLFASLPVTVPLRSADAIRVVTAAELGLTEIFSNDWHLLTGAPLLGLRGVDVTDTTGDHASLTLNTHAARRPVAHGLGDRERR